MNRLEEMERVGIVPVVVIGSAKDVLPTADALAGGGINVMEITLRTECALDAIREASRERSKMLIGAGTVCSLDRCKESVDAGARFIVTPGLNEAVVQWCLDNGVAVIPGCVTPTEIMRAASFGLAVVKFFPAHVYGGLSAIKALAAPFDGMRFVPTGGINGENLAAYLSTPAVYAVGGTWLCGAKDIAAGRFDEIRRLAGQAYETSLAVGRASVAKSEERPGI